MAKKIRSEVIETEQLCKQLLKEAKIEELDPQGRFGRPRLVSAMLFWSSVFASIIYGLKGMRSIWRLTAVNGVWGMEKVEVEDEAIYKRAKGRSWEIARKIFYKISELLGDIKDKAVGKLASFAKEIYVLDDTVLDKLAKKSKWLKGRDDIVLGGRISALYDVRRGRFHTVDITEEVHRNEKIPAWWLIDSVKEGSLLLFDLGYFGFRWFDELTDRSLYYISRLRNKTSFKIIHKFYESNNVKDSIIWLGKNRADQAKHAVRLVEVYYQRTWRRYITNVVDPKKLSVSEILNLYGRRWDIEFFKLVKRVLGLSSIWSSNFNAIKLQIYATLTIAHIVRMLRYELSRRAKVPIEDVSESLLVEWIPIILHTGAQDPFKSILEARNYGGIIRPSRRIKYEVPTVPQRQIKPLPPDLTLIRKPRYAERKSIHR